MNKKIVFSALVNIFMLSSIGCITTTVKPVDVFVKSEDAAVAKLGDDIDSQYIALYNKKIGVFYFTTLNWDVTPAGKRISNELADFLSKKGRLKIIPRREFDRIMRTQAVEKASIFDIDSIQKLREELPVDIIITGTIIPSAGMVEIDLNVVDVESERIRLTTGVRMPITSEFVHRENADLYQLYKKSPEKVEDMNRCYYVLKWMKTNQPLVFLLVTFTGNEWKSVKKTNAVLNEKLNVRKQRYDQERPDVIKKIKHLKSGLKLIYKYEPRRTKDIRRWKRDLLDKMK